MKNKHRVLYLRATSMPGAGTRVLVNWLNWLDQNGYGIFISAPYNGWIKEKLSKFENKRVLDAEFYIPKKRDYPRFCFLVLRMCVFVVVNRIDLIHCNSDIAYFTACTVARITKRPVVTHLRFHYEKDFYAWLFSGWRKPDLVVLVSESFRREEIEKIHAVTSTIPVKVLHNCIDLKEYPIVPVESQWKSQSVFYPAAISERKRQGQLFEIDKKTRDQDCNLQFIAAGNPKDSEYWDHCKKESEKYPENKVKFIGHVNDVAKEYKESFISLTLSDYETFGYSVLESMASGVPVVGYRVAAVEEVLGGSRYLVEVDNIDALVDVICNLRSDFEEWHAYSQRCLTRAQEEFSPEYICPKLIEMYDEVFQTRNIRSPKFSD